jgi:hypothetical protein
MVPFMLIMSDFFFFFLNEVLTFCITGNFPLFSAIFNVGACKCDSVMYELIM